MTLCFFGAYDRSYPRTAILRRGLELNGFPPVELRLPSGLKAWARYPLGLFLAFTRRSNLTRSKVAFFVPSFSHKDVPLAWGLARLFSRRLIFDPLASRYETKILDWRRKPEGSLPALWNHFLDRWTMRLADLVLADTAVHRAYYCQEFSLPEGKFAVLPVGFDDSVWVIPPESPPENRPFTVLFFGSFLPLHGLEAVVKAASLLSRERPLIRFHLIGSGQTFPRIKRLVEELGSSNVILEGWLPPADLVRTVWREADLCLGIFGQTDKARRVVPHKVFQAMALGKPVLTMETPAVKEFFRHREEIYLCPSSDPEAVAAGILELRRDEALRLDIAKRGQKLVREKYSPAPLGRGLLALMEKFFYPGGGS